MFSYVFMRILEGRPRSYDRQMSRLSRGRTDALKREVAEMVGPGDRVLEIGCGTGALAALLAARGARVHAFDLSPAMVAQARARPEADGPAARLTVAEMGVDGLDTLEAGAFSAVVSTLVFSELGEAERRYALRHARRLLSPGGRLVIADEVVPRTAGRRLVHRLVRAPLVAATYLVSRRATRALADPAAELAAAGFVVDEERRSHGDAFAVLVARTPAEGEAP